MNVALNLGSQDITLEQCEASGGIEYAPLIVSHPITGKTITSGTCTYPDGSTKSIYEERGEQYLLETNSNNTQAVGASINYPTFLGGLMRPFRG